MRKHAALIAICMAIAACQTERPATEVTLMLDWVPNTNHTGIYVADALGYFGDEGLSVSIVQPGEVFAEQAVASGAADFGISFQEQVTLARADDVPIVSIAAIIQSNSSGFASRGELGVDSPADWERLKYGSFGSPFEEPTLRVLMGCDGAQFETLDIVDVGFSDPLALMVEGQIDMAWIFNGWQGIQAEQQGIDLNVVSMEDWHDCVPDYYTPVIIASETTLTEHPEVVEALLSAVSRGYELAIEEPDRAAQILLDAVPELDAELVRASQAWLADRYRADAVRWGQQDLAIWDRYSRWMVENGIIDSAIEAAEAFTSEHLP